MPDQPSIRRALISVYDKIGIIEFARALHEEFKIELLSTGGTAKTLRDAGIPVVLIEDVTGFPELLDGRVKTLHPKIHAAILADRDNPDHMRQLREHGIEPIDLVVVNLYPFEKTVADPNCTFEQAIEMIDIGGVTLLRAAAKNHKHVIAHATNDYQTTLHFVRNAAKLAAEPRRMLAQAALATTSRYDAVISTYLLRDSSLLPTQFLEWFLQYWKIRYGENPHQQGGTYATDRQMNRQPTSCNLVSGRSWPQTDWGNEQCMIFASGRDKWSFNNYLDADAALGLCAELTRADETLRQAGKLWHRFPTGDLYDRFSTGRVSSSKKGIREETHSVRNLPHIQKPGATYFVTFRLLQQGALTETERDLTLSACRFWHEKKMTLHAAIVMPDHVHLLLTPHEFAPGQWTPLGEILHSIKRFSAAEINKLRDVQGPLWLDESFDRIVRDEREFIEKWEYMEANPVTAGIAEPGTYRWFWKSDTGFQETTENDRLKTGRTDHRLETGATVKEHRSPLDRTMSEISPPKSGGSATCVFIKHTNPCGVGIAENPLDAYRRAYLGDPNAAMGGILACNFEIDAEFAAAVLETYDRLGKPLKDAGAPHAPGGFFVEVWIAPAFSADAVAVIRGTAGPSETLPNPPKKKWGENVRLLAVGDMSAPPDPNELQYRSIAGGLLVQTTDLLGLNEEQWKVVTQRQPTEQELNDLRLAWLICKHTKSNAITLVKDGALLGNGAGQMSRVMSCRIATWLARENGHADALPGAAAASDAFFPFRDGPDLLIDAGVTALIQPGGSKRDEDTIRACDERGVAMIFTGTRHFKH